MDDNKFTMPGKIFKPFQFRPKFCWSKNVERCWIKILNLKIKPDLASSNMNQHCQT